MSENNQESLIAERDFVYEYEMFTSVRQLLREPVYVSLKTGAYFQRVNGSHVNIIIRTNWISLGLKIQGEQLYNGNVLLSLLIPIILLLFTEVRLKFMTENFAALEFLYCVLIKWAFRLYRVLL